MFDLFGRMSQKRRRLLQIQPGKEQEIISFQNRGKRQKPSVESNGMLSLLFFFLGSSAENVD